MCSSAAVPAAVRAHQGLLLHRLAAQSNDRGFQTSLTLDHISIGLRPSAEPKNNDRPEFPLVSTCVEPPAGIEPATPSLPSMRRWFTTLCNTPRRHTTAQVGRRFQEWERGAA